MENNKDYDSYRQTNPFAPKWEDLPEEFRVQWNNEGGVKQVITGLENLMRAIASRVVANGEEYFYFPYWIKFNHDDQKTMTLYSLGKLPEGLSHEIKEMRK